MVTNSMLAETHLGSSAVPFGSCGSTNGLLAKIVHSYLSNRVCSACGYKRTAC
ncbi:hypothetical protein [Candidatus Pseudoruminococcus sp.]|uniref:hypothetical protein n=1 Tax=Candidatus Pseudoruminococcus sp. TaxID=3101048 RepID=UPI0039998AE1